VTASIEDGSHSDRLQEIPITDEQVAGRDRSTFDPFAAVDVRELMPVALQRCEIDYVVQAIFSPLCAGAFDRRAIYRFRAQAA